MPAPPSPTWNAEGDKLVGSNGEIYDILPQPYWYLAPSRTKYQRGQGRVSPLEFAYVLHNASVGNGLVASLDILLSGIEPKPNKRGAAAEAELLLEEIRIAEFAHKPSRLRSYFLNFDRALAEHRAKVMFRDKRSIVRCLLIRNGGKYHFADVDVYERLENRPDDRKVARTYWQDFTPTNKEQYMRLEVLANSALYFPDWGTFPQLDDQSQINWMLDNPPRQRTDG